MPCPNLLEVLDAMVRADRGAPGFVGKIAVGLKAQPPRWWVVDVGSRAVGRFLDKTPEDVDAWLGLGSLEADAILGRAAMPVRASIVTAGDRTLIEHFFRRYVRNVSLVDLRADRGG